MSDSLSDSLPGVPSEERPGGRFTAFARKWSAAVRSCRPLLGCALVGLLGGTVYGALAPPQYSATTYVVAVPAKGSNPATTLGFTQAFGRISTSNATLVHAQDAAGVPARTLGRHVRAETSPESPMIGITGTATRAGTSARIANAVAEAITVSGNEVARNTGVRLVPVLAGRRLLCPTSPSLPISILVGGCARRAPARRPAAPGPAPKREHGPLPRCPSARAGRGPPGSPPGPRVHQIPAPPDQAPTALISQ